jgi:hypothetical protein
MSPRDGQPVLGGREHACKGLMYEVWAQGICLKFWCEYYMQTHTTYLYMTCVC